VKTGTSGEPLKKRLQDDEVVLGLKLDYPAAGIIECIGTGWDWLWIDGQHGQFDYRSMLECVRVAQGCGLAPIVRVPGHDLAAIGRALDMAPTGLMVPMVEDADQAAGIVRAAQFPPPGDRSYGGRRAIDLGGRKYFSLADRQSLLVLQIETPAALEHASRIASTPGVDVLFFGADDLKTRLGLPINGPVQHAPLLQDAMERMAHDARVAGKVAGCVVSGADMLRMAVAMGYRLICGGGDVVFLREAAKGRLQGLQKALKTPGSTPYRT